MHAHDGGSSWRKEANVRALRQGRWLRAYAVVMGYGFGWAEDARDGTHTAECDEDKRFVSAVCIGDGQFVEPPVIKSLEKSMISISQPSP